MFLLKRSVILTCFILLASGLKIHSQSIIPSLYLSPGYTIFHEGNSSYDNETFKGSGKFSLGAGMRLSKSFRHFMFHTGLELMRDAFRLKLHDFGHPDLSRGYIAHTYRYNAFSIPFLAGIPLKISGKRVLEFTGGASFGYRGLFSGTLEYEYPSPEVALLDTLHFNFHFDPVFGGNFRNCLHFGVTLRNEKPGARWSTGLLADYPLSLSKRQSFDGFIKYNTVDLQYHARIEPRVANLRLLILLRLGKKNTS